MGGLPLDVAAETMKQLLSPEWRLWADGEERKFTERSQRGMETWVAKRQAHGHEVFFFPPMQGDAYWYVAARLERSARPANCSPEPHLVSVGKKYLLLWRVVAPVSKERAMRIARNLVAPLGGVSAVGEPVPLPGTFYMQQIARRLATKTRVIKMAPARVPAYMVTDDDRLVPCIPEAQVSPFTDADTVKAKPIEWLWPNLVPCGCLTLLGGAPGMGKSQAAISMAAIVSKGAAWPCGAAGERGSALVLESEDDLERVITPRLIAAGADLRRVGLGKRIDLTAGIAALEAERKRRRDLRLVVLSPVREFFGEAVEARGNLAVREGMKPLLTWAETHSIAIVGIAHPPKGKEDKEAFAGSNAFLEVARAAYSVIPDPESEEPILKRRPRLLVSAKSNLSADDVRISYRIDGAMAGEIATSKVVWLA